MNDNNKKHIAVLGAGPAGLMAAWRLRQAGFAVTLFEQESVVGGMCATQTFKGRDGDYRFDYGGHRFITKNPELLAFIDELMGDDLLHAERKSVIRFGGRTYDYPLNLPNLLKTAPLALMAGAVKDLLLLPFAKKPTDFAKASFAEWIQSHFGRTLYRQFFEGYTGKLWGINPDKLSADWAGQRISLIDLKDVARRLLAHVLGDAVGAEPGSRPASRTSAASWACNSGTSRSTSTRGSPPVVPGRGSVPWYPMPSPTHSTRRTIPSTKPRRPPSTLGPADRSGEWSPHAATTRRVRAAGSGTANAMHRWSTAARRVAGRRCRRAMSASPGPVRTG